MHNRNSSREDLYSKAHVNSLPSGIFQRAINSICFQFITKTNMYFHLISPTQSYQLEKATLTDSTTSAENAWNWTFFIIRYVFKHFLTSFGNPTSSCKFACLSDQFK
ncbi:unnamed protein product [Adineta ricciae]|uniref:Uncharacterized protein n=1 Tax=Adineta ricciae TaxID=249248 RepID=A0A813RIM4_ADIRI|nr:unnamed protein product [Adineta ricciae]